MQSMQPRTPETIEREQQIIEARRLAAAEDTPTRRTISLGVDPRVVRRPIDVGQRPAAAPAAGLVERRKAPRQLDGHEAFLKALQLSNADVVIEKVSSGYVYFGKLRHTDKWSVTMNVTAIQYGSDGDKIEVAPADRVIFKHDISEFYTTTRRPTGEGFRV